MEFESDGHFFRIERMSVFGQLHLSRKIAPLLPPLAPLIFKYIQVGNAELLSGKILEIAELAEPFAEALAAMKDEDTEAVITLALNSVKVCTDVSRNVWMPLWAPQAKMAAVAELNDLGKLLPIVVKVITFNLGNFIAALLTRHEEGHPQPSGAVSPAGRTG